MDLLGQGVHKQQMQILEALLGRKNLNYLLEYVGVEQIEYGLHLMDLLGRDQHHFKMTGMMFVGLENFICLLLHLEVDQQIK